MSYPIKENEYNEALLQIEQLLDAKSKRELEMLQSLVEIVEMYEEEHFPIDPPDPNELMKFRMDQLG
jgi:HTH-type transcriptional regulator / antitoxin HigA